jgi:hypothetical protein
VAVGLDASKPTVIPLTGLPPVVNSVTVMLVPAIAVLVPTAAAGAAAATVDADGETTRVPKVTLIGASVRLAVVSTAVNFTTSPVVSVALKVASPEEFVVPVAGWGVICTLPVPESVTV